MVQTISGPGAEPKADPTTFASLVNGKLIVPSNSSNYYAVDKHFLFALLAPIIDRIVLDERWYLSRNPDVREAISKGIVKDGRDHFRRHGYFEGRLPYKIEIDALWYEKVYPDIEDAIRRKEFLSAQEHFDVVGYHEGRLPFPGFKLKALSE